LKVLSEREVTPQLGVLKSTLLQLDSTFSEREYGASTFRDFMEKVAHTGAVTLRHAGRSMLVEPNDEVLATVTGSTPAAAAAAAAAEMASPGEETAAAPQTAHESRESREPRETREPRESRDTREPRETREPRDMDDDEEESLPPSPMTMQDGIRAVQQAFTQEPQPRWPMYVRQAKQYLRNAVENFDERKYGFASVVDLLRAAGKEGVLRIERDRQGAIRIFPGANLVAKPSPVDEPVVDETEEVESVIDMATTSEPAETVSAEPVEPEPVAEPPIVDGEVASTDSEEEYVHEDGDVNGNLAGAEPKKPAARRRKTPAARAPRTSRAAKTTRPRARKTSR
jgi:hypothetical protein